MQARRLLCSTADGLQPMAGSIEAPFRSGRQVRKICGMDATFDDPDRSARPPGGLRLFYALWPDAAVREALRARQRSWHWPRGAALTRPERLHMTLHFLGELPVARLPELVAALPPPGETFELRLDRDLLWSGGLAVLLASEPPPALLALHRELGAALQAQGLPLDPRPFAAHVTLARRARHAHPPSQPEPVVWRARAAVLVESLRPQGGYRVLAGLPG